MKCKDSDIRHSFKIKITGTYFDRHFACWESAADFRKSTGHKGSGSLSKVPFISGICILSLGHGPI